MEVGVTMTPAFSLYVLRAYVRLLLTFLDC